MTLADGRRDRPPAPFGRVGQLGRPADASCSYTSPACAVPAAVTGPAFTQIDAGGLIGNYQAATTCGLTTSGTAMCWGGNRENAIGDGTTTNRSQPTLVVNSPPLRIISVGDFSACGIAISDGRSWCWGYHFGATATPLPYQP